MRVLLLSASLNPHTIKWVRSLAASGVEVCLFGLNACPPDTYADYPHVKLISLGIDTQIIRTKHGSYQKLRYLQALPLLKQAIKDFKPDIVHAHFATSYGLLGALSGFHPLVLSVWGGDVFDFPNASCLHRWLLKFNLRRADKILSTSHVMAEETWKYTSKPIEITPFGIDLAVFKAMPVTSLFAPQAIVIGTVKALEEMYGIEYLIRAFHLVRTHYPHLPLNLLIVGGGSLEQSLKALAHELALDDCVIFTGRVPYDDVPKYHNMLSVSVSVSNRESFGVAIIEASACEKPVVVSNVGGLPEVVEDGVTGIVVAPRDVAATAAAIERLILDENLSKTLGRAGRERVQRLYDWQVNVSHMLTIYQELLTRT